MNTRISKPSLLRSPWVWTFLWVLLAAAPVAAARFSQGDNVQVTGVITDPREL
mgnify:CR=1 FL=1